MISLPERLQGGLWGLLIGDALGVPYEFHPPQNLPAIADLEFVPPAGFSRSYPQVLPGTWSDDGAQALCLLASLLEQGRVAPEDLGQRLLRWYRQGYCAVGGEVFDIGNHTARVLQAIQAGVPALAAGNLGHQARGNGSLMRSLPLVLWHQGSDADLVAAAHLQSAVTHADPYCQVCCALYCLWARRLLQGNPAAWEAAVASLASLYEREATNLEILETVIRPAEPALGQGTGYVIDCLQSARLALAAGSYEQVVKAAIALGNDTDTTACVAGGLAGIRDGVAAIPARWRDHLRGQEIVQPLLTKLLARYQRNS